MSVFRKNTTYISFLEFFDNRDNKTVNTRKVSSQNGIHKEIVK